MVSVPPIQKNYREVEGAIYTGDPPIRPFKVKIVSMSILTKGVNDYVVTDEQRGPMPTVGAACVSCRPAI